MKKLLLFIIFISLVTVKYSFSDEMEKKFEGFNLQGYNDQGDKDWEVNAATADINGQEIKLNSVDANSFGKQSMNVTAETGYVDQVSGSMRLEKDVIITSETGAQLLTDSLDWDKESDLVMTNDDVMLTEEGMTITGHGMKAKPGLKNAVIREDVVVRVDTEPDALEQKILTITSDGSFTIDQNNNVAVFEVNVVASQVGQTLKADRMEIYFDEDMNGITGMVCLGNVEIAKDGNSSYADKAVYNAETQKLTLSGRPKLILITEGEGSIATVGN